MLVTVHIAQSLDGRLGLAGATTELSTSEGRRAAHLARAEHDAVLVGSGTVRIDDPQLTSRLGAHTKQPLAVVLASALDVSPASRIFTRNGPTLLIGTSASKRAGHPHFASQFPGADIAFVDSGEDGLVALRSALEELQRRNVKRLLVEGGSRVLTSFFRERLVDRVQIEIAMRFLGEPGTAAVGLLGVDTIDNAPALENIQVERLGSSVFVRGDVKR